MKRASVVAGRASGASAGLWACLLLLGWGALPHSIAAAAPPVRAQAAWAQAAGAHDVGVHAIGAQASPPTAESPPLRRPGLIDYVLGSRTRMIQIATMAMLLGL